MIWNGCSRTSNRFWKAFEWIWMDFEWILNWFIKNLWMDLSRWLLGWGAASRVRKFFFPFETKWIHKSEFQNICSASQNAELSCNATPPHCMKTQHFDLRWIFWNLSWWIHFFSIGNKFILGRGAWGHGHGGNEKRVGGSVFGRAQHN